MTRKLLTAFLTILWLLPAGAAAEDLVSKIDISRLEFLYGAGDVFSLSYQRGVDVAERREE